MENSLASELLSEIKRESRRRFILLIICIALLFITNLSWLIAWNLPSEEISSESYELEGDEGSNVILNGEGEVSINGEKADFTKPELDYFRENCNFVGIEIKVFELRSQGVPLEEIAEITNMSVDGIKKVSRRVNKKIIKTL